MLRIPTILAVITLGAAFAAAPALPAGAAKKPPVKLSGSVTNQGVVKASGGAAAIEAQDFFFAKTFVKAPAGQVTLTVTNRSDTPHTFTIEKQDIDTELAPGAEVTVTVDVAAGKATEFVCRFHVSAGMKGAVFTKKGTAASRSPASGSTGSSGSSGYGY